MSSRSKTLALAACGALCLAAPLSADVECWAPGMESPISLKQGNASRSITITKNGRKPYRYDVYGVAGNLTLGDQANGAMVHNGVFKKTLLNLGLPIPGENVNSTASAALRTRVGLIGRDFYPARLIFSGNRPGRSSGAIQQYAQTWTLRDPKNPVDVDLEFHLSGSSLLNNLLNGLVGGLLGVSSYYNLNPSGYFYVLGECHWAPPELTGNLEVSSETVYTGYPVKVSYTIDRHEVVPHYPNLLGLNLGEVNLTLLGTPPSSSPSSPSAGPAPVPHTGNGTLVSAVINLNAAQGEGWAKILVLPP